MKLKTPIALVLTISVWSACGPVPKPKDAYSSSEDIIGAVKEKSKSAESFRIVGRVDHFGEKHRIQGKAFFFSKLPDKLRIELVSPFNSPLNVLTVNEKEFALHDIREAKYMTGPAEPCNIARLIQIPLPSSDVIRILLGYSPIMEGKSKVEWDTAGFYRVTITDKDRVQKLEIGPDKNTLPVFRSVLEDKEGIVFDITYSRHQTVSGVSVPHEIRVKMPREKADLLIRYNTGEVEFNVELPPDSWEQAPPAGLEVEHVTCS